MNAITQEVGAAERDPALAALDYADSFNRAEALLRLYHRRDLMTRHEWFVQLGFWWGGCDTIGRYRAVFAGIIRRAKRDELDLMMDGPERAAWDAMPQMLTVYRGCYGFNRLGLSWSLSRSVAEKFVTQYARYTHAGYTPLILTGRVSKTHTVYKNDRDEVEVIAARVRVIDRQELTAAAIAIGARLAFPTFRDGEVGTDFNDMAQREVAP